MACRLCCLLFLLMNVSGYASAEEVPELSWIWSKESEPIPAGKRWFRKAVFIDRPISNPVDVAIIEITADDEFTLWFNGKKIGSGNTWKTMYRF
ncbi:MAG TPA: hypothetical protein PKA06_12940, partial [Gemmatales bacterium]|nr:hypothetical protein [Gemmatales bacterium]